MFSKDPVAASYAQGALRTMALLDPDLIMPELLERAFGGLEVVNETHRTTAVLGMLSGICVPLTAERVWLGGQKHLVPLLELCIPGIDLVSHFPAVTLRVLMLRLQNDPVKTVCATMFIVSAVQHVRIGELSYNSGLPVDSEDPADAMEIDADAPPFPDGVDVGEVQKLSRSEERSLTIDSTAGFAGMSTPRPLALMFIVFNQIGLRPSFAASLLFSKTSPKKAVEGTPPAASKKKAS